MTSNELRGARQSLGLTQEQLADEIGASLASVRNWEQGRCRVNRVAAKQIETMLKSIAKQTGDTNEHGEDKNSGAAS